MRKSWDPSRPATDQKYLDFICEGKEMPTHTQAKIKSNLGRSLWRQSAVRSPKDGWTPLSQKLGPGGSSADSQENDNNLVFHDTHFRYTEQNKFRQKYLLIITVALYQLSWITICWSVWIIKVSIKSCSIDSRNEQSPCKMWSSAWNKQSPLQKSPAEQIPA